MSATDFPNMCGGFPGLTSVGFPGFPGFPKYLWRISRTYLRRISRISQVLWRISRTYHRRISRISQVPVADFPDLPPSDFPVFPDFPKNLTTVVFPGFPGISRISRISQTLPPSSMSHLTTPRWSHHLPDKRDILTKKAKDYSINLKTTDHQGYST